MTAIPTSRMLRPGLTASASDAIFSLLAPSVRCSRSIPGIASTPVARFSTTPALCKRDNSRSRGLSAMRSTGLRPRQTLSVKQKDFENQELPKPLEINEKVEGDPNHGLWDFFKDGKLIQTPLEESRHGRAWTVGELRSRDWDTLHALWWVCVKERNRLATDKLIREDMDADYGGFENKNRDKAIQETMKAIMDTLAERHHAYEEAYSLAEADPSIDLHRTDGPQLQMGPEYSPYEEESVYEDEPEPEKNSKDSPQAEDTPKDTNSKEKAKVHTIT